MDDVLLSRSDQTDHDRETAETGSGYDSTSLTVTPKTRIAKITPNPTASFPPTSPIGMKYLSMLTDTVNAKAAERKGKVTVINKAEDGDGDDDDDEDEDGRYWPRRKRTTWR